MTLATLIPPLLNRSGILEVFAMGLSATPRNVTSLSFRKPEDTPGGKTIAGGAGSNRDSRQFTSPG
jgi:hypothetical protein